MSANKDEILKQFCDVTGADEGRCKFFLESSNWQLEVALSSFYENGGNIDEMPPMSTSNTISLSDSDMESPPVSPKAPKEKKPVSTNQNFATLSSLQQDSSSDEEEGQAFYAGGSERSGQQIIGPGKGRGDIVSQMFKSVRERGAVSFEDEPSSTSRGGGVFSGAGYRLGQTADDHEQVTPPAAQTKETGPRSVRLRLYREGFTVDSGPVRSYADKDNAEFLDYIRRGEIPPSLSCDGEVRVSLEDHRHEQCPKTTNRSTFSGKGQMLGSTTNFSPTPPTVGATVPITSDVADKEANQRSAQDNVKLDEQKPTTTVQIRLSDGSRLTGRFNHSHTVSDIRQFILTAAPQYQLQTFILMTTFPSVELTDSAATIAQANLINSVVVQRVK